MSDHSTRVALVTGTSSGIGAATARELLRREWRVVGASRRAGDIEHARYTHVCVDLENVKETVAALDARAGGIVFGAGVSRLALVNNAASLALLGPVDQVDPAALLGVYAVNVAAPIALMGWVLRRSEPDTVIRLVNVSSGAAVRAFAGVGAYGSSKAALRMAGMVLAAELDASEARGEPRRDVTILSFEPGVVDTPMQATSRAASVDVLPSVAFFKDLAATGRLQPPSAPAGLIADYVDADGHARFSERRYEPRAGS